MLRVVVVRMGALQPVNLEMGFEVGSPVLTTVGGAVSLTANNLEMAFEVGSPVLSSNNLIAANNVEMAMQVGSPDLDTSPLIAVGSATYTPGGSGSGPTLNITDLELTGTTGPYDVFLATHASATTLTKDQIENGTGDAEDALTFSDADGVVNG